MNINEIIAGLRFESMREMTMAQLDPKADHKSRAQLFAEAAALLREKYEEDED